MTLEQNMGIDSGTLLEEQQERGRQRPLSEANRRAQEEPGAGGAPVILQNGRQGLSRY